jgi:hypothetical protein
MREMGSRPLKSKLLEQARALMRVKHRSIRTEAAYLAWMERFLRFHRDRAGRWVHPAEIENSHVEVFLTYLALAGKVAANTQYQAFFALLFLFREVLKMPLEVNAVRGKAPRHVPVGLWVDEVRQWLDPTRCQQVP